jgi:hypothetical protein
MTQTTSALLVLGERGDHDALRRAVEAHEAALLEYTLDRAPRGGRRDFTSRGAFRFCEDFAEVDIIGHYATCRHTGSLCNNRNKTRPAHGFSEK